MLRSSELFCAVCGAANNPQDSHCFACHQPLQPATVTATTATIQLLRQRYHVLKRLGQGGMGSVYQAEDMELGKRLVAIKELSQRGLNQHEATEAEEAFKHEALLLAGLMHPNLPRIYDNFAESGRWYLVMDFIEGETLEDYLAAEGGKLPWPQLYEISIQICNVLQYLHTRPTPIIFRDLKPLNIMVTPGPQVYLIDFGIARLFKPGQARDTIAFGSPGYAAPEQYGRAQTAPSADIYSLGAIIYQMLTGRDPSTTPFSFPPTAAASPQLQALLDQMLVLDASQRISDADIVKQTLQHINSRQDNSANKPAPLLQTKAPTASSYTSVSPQQTSAPAVPNPPTPARPLIPRKPLPQPIPAGPPPTIGNLMRSYQNHTDVVSALAWSPDSTRIASASYDRTIQIANIDSQQAPLVFHRGDKRPARDRATVIWSPPGKQIAAIGDDGLLQIWQIDPAREINRYKELKDTIHALAWSPDGTLLASTSLNSIRIWDPLTGDTLTHFEGAYGTILTLAWSPDSTRVAIGYDSAIIQILRLDQQNAKLEPATIYMEQLKDRHSQANALGQVHKVAWSPDTIHQVAWSPDGVHIASVSTDKSIHVWDAATGRYQLSYHGHTEAVYALDWSPDSTSIVSASADRTIQIWNAHNGKRRYTYAGYNPTIYALAWSPNGDYIASGAHSRVLVWSAK